MMMGTMATIGAQEDSRQPTTLAAGSAPGESGATVLRAAVRFFSDI